MFNKASSPMRLFCAPFLFFMAIAFFVPPGFAATPPKADTISATKKTLQTKPLSTTQKKEDTEPPVRLAFDWPEKNKYEATLSNGDVILNFYGNGLVEWEKSKSSHPDAYQLKSVSEEKGVYKIILSAKDIKKIQHSRNGNKVYVDLLSKVTDNSSAPRQDIKKTPATKEPLPLHQDTSLKKTEEHTPPISKNLIQHVETVNINTKRMEGAVHLTFEWAKPVALAVARRENFLWIVFDHPSKLQHSQVLSQAKGYIESLTPYSNGQMTLLRLKIPFNVHADVTKDKHHWTVSLYPHNTVPMNQSSPYVMSQPNQRFKYHYPILGAKHVYPFTDPDVGDTIYFVPTTQVGYGFPLPSQNIDFELLSSVQGTAIIPIRNNLKFNFHLKYLELDHPKGLMLSSNGDRARQKRNAVDRKLFDFQTWGRFDDSFSAQRQKLQKAVLSAPKNKKNKARLDLAAFLVARAQGEEALGTLEYIKSLSPSLEKDPGFLSLRGSAYYLTGDYNLAEADFSAKELADEPEAKIWLGMIAAKKQNWSKSYQYLRLGRLVVARYPDTLKPRFTFLAAETAYQVGALVDAQKFLNALDKTALTLEEGERYKLEESKILYKSKKTDKALKLWDDLISNGRDQKAKVEATYLKAYALLDSKKISDPEAINLLETVRYSWRGDSLELKILHGLAQLYYKVGNHKEWLSLLRSVVDKFPNAPHAQQYKKELDSAVELVFTDSLQKPIPPIVMLGLYRDFRNLIPRNEKGERMMLALVNRLIQVDLLTEASKVLKYQVRQEKDPKKKMRLATKLATLQFLDRRPQKSLKTLNAYDDEQALSPQLRLKRLHLKARALSTLQNQDGALELLKEDHSKDAIKIKAEIYWSKKEWGKVAEELAKIEAHTKIGKEKLSSPDEIKEHALRILDIAIALTLAEKKDDLKELVKTKAQFVKGTPYEAAFNMIVFPKGNGIPLEQDAIRERIAQIGQFEGFVSTYRKKLEVESLDAL